MIDLFHSSVTSNILHRDVVQFYRNFYAFKCSGMLYSMWYEKANLNLIKGSNLGTNTEEHIEKDHTIEYSCKIILKTDEALYYCNEDTFFSSVSYLSSILLSDLNILHQILELELNRIDEKLLELDIKRRLNEHIFSRKKVSVDKQLSNIDETVSSEVSEMCCHMINTVNIVEKGNIFDLCTQHNKSGDHGNVENRMLSCYLTGLRLTLLGKMKKLLSDIKDVAFPSPNDSFLILMLLLSNYRKDDVKITRFRETILSWGIRHGIDLIENGYIKKLMSKYV